MYHSITFGKDLAPVIENVNGVDVCYPYGKGEFKNTWTDWKIAPSSRPLFNPPKQKTNYIDIPGSSGTLDFSESLTGYPVYDNREGSFEFYVMNDYKPWQERYSEIMGYLHGRTMQVILDDDPKWAYQGRFSVDGWKSSPTWSMITISYNVGPYKSSIVTSVEGWAWDQFVFGTDIIWITSFKDIAIDSDVLVDKTFEGVLFGSGPICPEFVVVSTDGLGMDVQFLDKTVHLDDGKTLIPEFIFYGQSLYTVKIKGHGVISIDFRSRRL